MVQAYWTAFWGPDYALDACLAAAFLIPAVLVFLLNFAVGFYHGARRPRQETK